MSTNLAIPTINVIEFSDTLNLDSIVIHSFHEMDNEAIAQAQLLFFRRISEYMERELNPEEMEEYLCNGLFEDSNYRIMYVSSNLN